VIEAGLAYGEVCLTLPPLARSSDADYNLIERDNTTASIATVDNAHRSLSRPFSRATVPHRAREDIASRNLIRTRHRHFTAASTQLSTLDNLYGAIYSDTYWRGGAYNARSGRKHERGKNRADHRRKNLGRLRAFQSSNSPPILGFWSCDAAPRDLRASGPAIEESPSARPFAHFPS
jgi:hypothetical protein